MHWNVSINLLLCFDPCLSFENNISCDLWFTLTWAWQSPSRSTSWGDCSIFIDRSHRNSSYLLMNLKFIQYQKVFEMMFRKKTGRSSKSQNRSSCFRNWTSRSCWKNCHPEYQDTRNSREVPITSFWVQRFSFNFQQLPSHQMLSSNKSLSWNCTGLTEYHPHNIFYFPQSSYLPKSPS